MRVEESSSGQVCWCGVEYIVAFVDTITKRETVSHVFSLTPRLGRVVAEEWLRILLSLVSSDSFPPDVRTPSDNTFSAASRCSCRSDIEVEDWFTCRLRLTRVVVNHITNLLFLAVDVSRNVPVVSVKGRFSAACC